MINRCCNGKKYDPVKVDLFPQKKRVYSAKPANSSDYFFKTCFKQKRNTNEYLNHTAVIHSSHIPNIYKAQLNF